MLSTVIVLTNVFPTLSCTYTVYFPFSSTLNVVLSPFTICPLSNNSSSVFSPFIYPTSSTPKLSFPLNVL